MDTVTLLLDLDDTLLDTNMQAFAPAYFGALAASLADRVAPEVMLPALMAGTKAMMLNEDPSRSLSEVFDAVFFPQLGMERQALADRIDRFYDDTFPSLAHVASQRPAAVEFVRWAFQSGYRIGVATNPYFPLKAVHHRMRWAGLPPEDNDFALVSSYENFHFTKESPAYFSEFLAQLGWQKGPVVMVGNDLDMDLLPARKAGLAVFWLRLDGGEKEADIPQGDFSALRQWLETTDPVSLTPAFDTPEAVLNILRSTPAALATLLRNLALDRWVNRPGEGEWSLTEIVCHLRDVETEINLRRIERVLAEDNPLLAGVVSDDWVETRNYASQDGDQALQGFLTERKKAVATLVGAGDSWNRPARHTIFGPTTLLELSGIIAGHDRDHVHQIWKTLQA